MKQRKKPFKWRRWNNVLHRDIGYLCAGLTVVYAISGVAVNHRADWNPNYRITSEIVSLAGSEDLDPTTPGFAGDVLDQLGLSGEVQGLFRRSPERVDIFLENLTVAVDLERGQAALEGIKGRGAWLTAIGVVIPILFLLLYR